MAKPTVNPDASKKIDAYLTTVSSEHRPVLELIRKTVNAVDDRIQEDWKWRAPCFSLEGLVCWFVAFKSHVGLNFFKGALIEDIHNAFVESEDEDKGNRMIHFKSIDEVKVKVIQDYVKQAVLLNEQGIKIDFPKRKTLETPDYLIEALNKNKKAKDVFESFTDAQRKDYIEWLVEAKREETRNKRMTQAIEWIAEGKTRNWKYMNC
ncbi:MAG: YdeI/OmpD-associated family protein [Reichenbachiella sp.]|uniref:YdeI/OmpD-associated family protein n=1 Tax=Reichenbachiella sp. TaxID=2184521 RepID=UPI0032656048